MFIKISCFVLSLIFLSYICIFIIFLQSFSAGCLSSTAVAKVDTCHKHYIHNLTFIIVPSTRNKSLIQYLDVEHPTASEDILTIREVRFWSLFHPKKTKWFPAGDRNPSIHGNIQVENRSIPETASIETTKIEGASPGLLCSPNPLSWHPAPPRRSCSLESMPFSGLWEGDPFLGCLLPPQHPLPQAGL